MVDVRMRFWGLVTLVFVCAFAVSGCPKTGQEAEACAEEGEEVCSDNGNSILICEDGKFRALENCAANMEVCEDDGEGPDCIPQTTELPFEKVVECADDGLADFNTYLDELIYLLKKVDDPSASLPPGTMLDWEAGGEFTAEVDAGVDGVVDEMSGIVRPQADCDDGMTGGEICIFEWSTTRGKSTEEIAFGTMSALRLTSGASTQFQIVDRSPQTFYSDTCNIEVTAFATTWRLREDGLYSLHLEFTVSYSEGGATSKTRGAAIWGAEPGEPLLWVRGDDIIETVTFQTPSGNVDCDFGLRDFDVMCDL
jgi:hypothetical protein